MNLKSMSVDKLMDLRTRVDAALGTKVAQTRRTLESQLAKLGRAGKGFSRGGAAGKIAPKYRNPDNPSETWAGRGLQPRWLAAALKSGKKLEHFAIAAPAKAAMKKSSKKTGRPRKKK
ncbi:MAG TPA: H-NS histone family protein [Candidatus Sulfotelmatobacter sp.]